MQLAYEFCEFKDLEQLIVLFHHYSTTMIVESLHYEE